jgi:serine/threonine protein kinase
MLPDYRLFTDYLPIIFRSLGCTIVEMLTGKPPYAELSGFSFISAVCNKTLSYKPCELVPNAGELMKDFLLSLLQKDCDKRPHTGGEATVVFNQYFGL